MMKKVLLSSVIECLGEMVIQVAGRIGEKFIDNLADPKLTTTTTLDWVSASNTSKQAIVEQSIAATILVDPEVEWSEKIKEQGKTLIYVENPRKAVVKIGNSFFVQKPKFEIHPTAIIDKEAIIGNNVSIDAYAVIGKAVIGDGTVIGSHVRIYDGVQIGKRCVVANHVSLGGCGFGFEKDEEGHWVKFPQIGGLIIGDEVELGTFVTIDRGALSNTTVGSYTKIDSCCKIAHNSVIGDNVIIAGCTSIGGSNTIEDNVWIAPHVSTKEWSYIGKNSFVGIGSVVIRDVMHDTRMFGNPAKKIISVGSK